MDAKLIQLKEGVLHPNDLRCVVNALADGQLIILPTETVYGLVADERHPQALQRIIDLKGRAPDQPFSRLAASLTQIEKHGGELNTNAKRLAEKFWPGALTMVCPHRQGGTMGYRIPDHPLSLAVLDAVAAPLLGTSVNRHGGSEALTGHDAYALFGKEVALVIDGGPTQIGQASTVVRIEPTLEILREGGITLKALEGAVTI